MIVNHYGVEFGYELIAAIPFAYWLHQHGELTGTVSNHDTEVTRKLYCNANKIITKQVNRSISGGVKGRKQVGEILAVYNKRKRKGDH